MFFLEDLRPHSSVLGSSSNPLEIMRKEIICPYFLVQIILHPGGFPINFSAFFFTSLFWPLMVDLRERKIGRWVESFLICLSYPSHLDIANHRKLTVCFRWPGLQLYPFILVFCVLRPSSHLPFLWYHHHLFFPGLMTVLLLFQSHGTGTILLCRMSICLQIQLGFPDCQLLESLCNFIPRIASMYIRALLSLLFVFANSCSLNEYTREVRKAAKINETVKEKNLATMFNVMECSSKCNDPLLNLK